jgi:hypothetical protein
MIVGGTPCTIEQIMLLLPTIKRTKHLEQNTTIKNFALDNNKEVVRLFLPLSKLSKVNERIFLNIFSRHTLSNVEKDEFAAKYYQ